jgi:hypothetical protein
MRANIKKEPGALDPPGAGCAHAALNLDRQVKHFIAFLAT